MITLIDYGMGNLRSVAKALEHVGAEIELTNDAARIAAADALVLPGVGNFGDGMRELESLGMIEPLREAAAADKPLLGICLGLQLLFESSEEAPGVPGLGILDGKVIRFPEMGLKIPQMGWNQLALRNSHPYLNGVPDNSWFYFVHSFYVAPEDELLVCGTSDYGIDFCACAGQGNLFATQFHPEKSQDCGLQILRNFVSHLAATNRKSK